MAFFFLINARRSAKSLHYLFLCYLSLERPQWSSGYRCNDKGHFQPGKGTWDFLGKGQGWICETSARQWEYLLGTRDGLCFCSGKVLGDMCVGDIFLKRVSWVGSCLGGEILWRVETDIVFLKVFTVSFSFSIWSQHYNWPCTHDLIGMGGSPTWTKNFVMRTQC